MRKSSKIISAAAIAVLAAAGGTAFTATGVATGSQARDAQFIGGAVSQHVDGATLNSIVYGFDGGPTGPKTAVTTVTLTFTDAVVDGHTVGVTPSGGSVGTVGTFSCPKVGVVVGEGGTTKVSVCTYVPTTNEELGYVGLSDLKVTVD